MATGIGIYKITSPTGRIYIGKTKDLKNRIKAYRCLKVKNQTILKNSILKYGWGAHKLEIIHELPIDIDNEILNNYEILYIQQYMANKNKYPNDIGMNMTDGGDGVVGYIFTKEAIENIKIGMEGKRNDLKGEDCWQFGLRGKDAPAFGFRHTDEAKKRISQANMGGKHNMAIKVMNINTGEVFGCIKEAAKSVNMPYSFFRERINGKRGRINNTGFKILI